MGKRAVVAGLSGLLALGCVNAPQKPNLENRSWPVNGEILIKGTYVRPEDREKLGDKFYWGVNQLWNKDGVIFKFDENWRLQDVDIPAESGVGSFMSPERLKGLDLLKSGRFSNRYIDDDGTVYDVIHATGRVISVNTPKRIYGE